MAVPRGLRLIEDSVTIVFGLLGPVKPSIISRSLVQLEEKFFVGPIDYLKSFIELDRLTVLSLYISIVWLLGVAISIFNHLMTGGGHSTPTD